MRGELKIMSIKKEGLSNCLKPQLVKQDKLAKAVTECKILRATIDYINKQNAKPAHINKS